jgi:hypothetical protein
MVAEKEGNPNSAEKSIFSDPIIKISPKKGKISQSF